MSAKATAREVINSLNLGIVNTPESMSTFFDDTQKQLKVYGVPPAVISKILGQCTNGTLKATIKNLELNNVQID